MFFHPEPRGVPFGASCTRLTTRTLIRVVSIVVGFVLAEPLVDLLVIHFRDEPDHCLPSLFVWWRCAVRGFVKLDVAFPIFNALHETAQVSAALAVVDELKREMAALL